MISSVEARVYVHATERREKVLKALLEVFPPELREKASIDAEELEGHHGNTIEVLTATLKEGEAAFRYLLSRLDELDRARLKATLGARVDKGGDLFLRLSKQEAFLGRLALEDSDDVVRVRFSFSGKREEALRAYGVALEST
ncbi:MAG: RNA-binding domain-containing protein [Acidilobaceae archaeon]